MLESHKVRQPNSFERFRCIGADCEDTCCDGWAVSVDRATWEKYQSPELCTKAGMALDALVEINPSRSSDGDHARIRLAGTRCPAMVEGWCAVQKALGEQDIPDLCSAYPRVVNVIGENLERSLHTSCPEAARLILCDPASMIVSAANDGGQTYRPSAVTFTEGYADPHLVRARELMAQVIRERSLPLWQRIVSFGLLIDRIAEMDPIAAIPVIEAHLRNLRESWLADMLSGIQPNTEFQIETVLELVIDRIGADYTSPRFLECYGEFMNGMAWTSTSTMTEIVERYRASLKAGYSPFVDRHPHVLENFILNYVFRTVFPYRRRTPENKFVLDSSRVSMTNAFILLGVHIAIIRTVLIGMAAVHKETLSLDHVVKLVQSYSKAFLHTHAFEAAALARVAGKGQHPVRLVALLLMD